MRREGGGVRSGKGRRGSEEDITIRTYTHTHTHTHICSCVSRRSREPSVGNEKRLQLKQLKRLLPVTTRRQPGWRRSRPTLPCGSRRSTTH